MKDGKAPKYKLGVFDPKLGSIVQETWGIPCVANEHVGEVLRGVRAHFTRYLDGLKDAGARCWSCAPAGTPTGHRLLQH